MKAAILDTSFIMTSVKQKIDFFSWLEDEGIKALVPNLVIKELKGLKADLALKIMEKNKFQTINFKGKNTDKEIIDYAKTNPRIIVATLDREIKKVRNQKLIIRQTKKLEVI